MSDPRTQLGRLIGTWDFDSSVEGRFMGRGTTTFEWTQDGAFVRQRADDVASADTDAAWAAHSPMPVTTIIGFDDTTGECAMLYADARGVFRIYRMSLTDDAWTMWREAPNFFQRFVGRFGDGDTTVTGRWETSPDGSTWTRDFDMHYQKRTDQP